MKERIRLRRRAGEKREKSGCRSFKLASGQARSCVFAEPAYRRKAAADSQERRRRRLLKGGANRNANARPGRNGGRGLKADSAWIQGTAALHSAAESPNRLHCNAHVRSRWYAIKGKF
jgi:hypothetical protein